MTRSPKPSARQDVIRRLREAKGWSQQALADRAITSFKTISNLERGYPAQLTTFAKVAKALGVEPSDLIDGYQPDPPPGTQTTMPEGKRVEVKLTLSIPFEDFDETEGLDRLVGLFVSLLNNRNAVAVTDVSPGSVRVTMLVDENDVPQLVQAFAQHKLDSLKATKLDLPRASVLAFIAGLVAQGAANPILVPVLPFIGFMLFLNHLKQAGIGVTYADADHIRFTRNAESSCWSTDDSASILPSIDASAIRQAVEFVTPSYLTPSFPYQVSLRLKPNEDSAAEAERYGTQLESLLSGFESLHGKVRRASPGPGWTGELVLELQSVADLRAMTEAVLTGFLGQPVTLVATQQKTGTILGGHFTMDAKVETTLSASVWNSVAETLQKELKLTGPESH